MSVSSPHVVILEGEPVLADAFAARFARERVRVTALTDFVVEPADLLGMLPDLVVLDPSWGFGLGGLSLLRRLRADPDGRELPVITSPTITPINRERYGAELRGLGAVLLPDPFDAKDLLAAARAAVARAREARQRSDSALARLSSGRTKLPPF